MWEIIKAFHEALRTDSTWPFVLIIALGGAMVAGLGAWVLDTGYKRNIEAVAETAYPVIDFDFQSGDGKLFARIVDRGEFALRTVKLEATQYTLARRQAITAMSKIGGSVLLAQQIGSRGGESNRLDIGGLMPLLIFEPSSQQQHGRQTPLAAEERFYALRFTFLHGGKKRFSFYKVVSAMPPYVLMDESPLGWGWATGGRIPIEVAKGLITAPRSLILDDQRAIPWPDNAEEYIPNKKALP